MNFEISLKRPNSGAFSALFLNCFETVKPFEAFWELLRNSSQMVNRFKTVQNRAEKAPEFGLYKVHKLSTLMALPKLPVLPHFIHYFEIRDTCFATTVIICARHRQIYVWLSGHLVTSLFTFFSFFLVKGQLSQWLLQDSFVTAIW